MEVRKKLLGEPEAAVEEHSDEDHRVLKKRKGTGKQKQKQEAPATKHAQVQRGNEKKVLKRKKQQSSSEDEEVSTTHYQRSLPLFTKLVLTRSSERL